MNNMMKPKTKKNKKYYLPFTYTHHTPTKLLEEFTLHNSTKDYWLDVMEYVKGLTEFDRTIWLLNMEYNSYRLVAEETNINYSTVRKIIVQINCKIVEIINNNDNK